MLRLVHSTTYGVTEQTIDFVYRFSVTDQVTSESFFSHTLCLLTTYIVKYYMSEHQNYQVSEVL